MTVDLHPTATHFFLKKYPASFRHRVQPTPGWPLSCLRTLPLTAIPALVFAPRRASAALPRAPARFLHRMLFPLCACSVRLLLGPACRVCLPYCVFLCVRNKTQDSDALYCITYRLFERRIAANIKGVQFRTIFTMKRNNWFSESVLISACANVC